MKIAQFKNANGYVTLFDWNEHRKDNDAILDYVRCSEWVQVEFPQRAPEELIPAQLSILDAAEQELRVKFEEKLRELADMRAKLLSLTYTPPTESAGQVLQ